MADIERVPAKLGDLQCATMGYGVVHHSCGAELRTGGTEDNRKLICDRCSYGWRMEMLGQIDAQYIADRFWLERAKHEKQHVLIWVTTELNQRHLRCVTHDEWMRLCGTDAKPELLDPALTGGARRLPL